MSQDASARIEQTASTSGAGRRKRYRYLRVAIAAGLLILILRWIDLRVLGDTIAGADLRYILLILAAAFLDRYLMAYKWNMLLKVSGNPLSNAEAFRIYLASGFVGTFLPTGVGADVFRAFRTSVGGRGVGGVTASIVVERVVGIVVVVITAVVGLGILVQVREDQLGGLYILAWMLLVVLVAVLFVSIHHRTFEFAKRLLSRHQQYRLVHLYLDFHRAYVEYRQHKKKILLFSALTLLELSVLILMNFWGARAIGLSVDYLFFVAIIPFAVVITRLPISVGALGVQEGVYIVLFGRAGLGPTEAFSLAVLMRVIGWLMLIPTGLALFFDSVVLRRLQGKSG